MIGLVRKMTLVVPLILALVIPFVLLSDSVSPVRDTLTNLFTGEGKSATAADPTSDLLSSLLMATPTDQSSSMAQPLDLRSALRFDISPRWVLDRWPSVSTTRSEQRFDGLRVPLITGTSPFDLAGSMTYYFDEQSQLQRISFRGYTGDGRHIVSIATGIFGMQPHHAVGASIYVSLWNGKPTSALLIRRLAIVQSSTPNQKFEVELEINRPNHHFGLSSHFESLLATSTANKPSTAQIR